MSFDKVEASSGVSICDYHEDHDGKFYGIIYSENEGVDCGVSSPTSDKKAYDGPCKSGWVKMEFLLILAG